MRRRSERLPGTSAQELAQTLQHAQRGAPGADQGARGLGRRAYDALRAGDVKVAAEQAAKQPADPKARRLGRFVTSRYRYPADNDAPFTRGAMNAAWSAVESAAGSTDADGAMALYDAMRTCAGALFDIDPPPPLGASMTLQALRERFAAAGQSPMQQAQAARQAVQGGTAGDMDPVVFPGQRVARLSDYVRVMRGPAERQPDGRARAAGPRHADVRPGRDAVGAGDAARSDAGRQVPADDDPEVAVTTAVFASPSPTTLDDRGRLRDLGRMNKIGVIGSGQVGQTLADGFLKHGYEVTRGSREVGKLDDWKKGAGPKAHTASVADTARFGDVVVLAVKGTAAQEAVALAGAALDGKIVLDTTNPIADAPPEGGVLQYFTGPNESLLERLQKKAPAARFVKAFSSVGAALMINPKLPSRPSMFICGNDSAAKETARAILDQFGWDTEDMGGAAAARAIEPLCMLWCIPGLLRNDWAHAFKVLRP